MTSTVMKCVSLQYGEPSAWTHSTPSFYKKYIPKCESAASFAFTPSLYSPFLFNSSWTSGCYRAAPESEEGQHLSGVSGLYV